ncbi:hypothetical protein BHG40_22105 [Aeromonas salmonicida subsp. masoucida]|nr:hypothetical protein BHG40_22105 [Aeromonas salmonicida subsp. masoucida]
MRGVQVKQQNQPKTCANCLHQATNQRGESVCTRLWVRHHTDHSTGITTASLTLCQTTYNERASWAPWACGKKGRHFEAKEVAA